MSGTLRWGILGTGNIAKQFAGGVQTAKRSMVTAVGSRDEDAAEKFGETYSVENRFGSYDELIADPLVDAVYNSLPNSLHMEWTIKALQAGKHVLCEKPFAMDLTQSEAMFEEAERQGKLLAEAFMYRSHPLTHAVMESVKCGAIGEIKAIRTSFCYRTSRPTGNVRFVRELGGGGLMDVGCYCINFCRMIARSEPLLIAASAHMNESKVDDVCAGVLQFPGDIVATFICGMNLQGDNTASILGNEGYIEVPVPWKPPAKGATYVIARGTPPRMDGGKGSAAAMNPRETRTVDAGAELYAMEADDFAESVLDGKPLTMTRADTLGNMRVIDEMRKQIGLRFD
jgi:D-xylose 1-dehydrogenase (NADP+, D-xylono-1,5-lactone-forming)